MNNLELFEVLDETHSKFMDQLKSLNERKIALLFGVSKAGKSTLLARLTDQSSPRDFIDKMPKHDPNDLDVKSIVKINEIEIGPHSMSTTLNPNYRQIDGIDCPIFDMPGLADTDRNKELIISILIRSFLSNYTKFIFIVVVNASHFNRNEFHSFRRNYISEFEKLFGKQYNSGLTRLYFAITHLDEVMYKIENFDTILNSIIVEQAQGTDIQKTIHLINRIKENHFFVDYSMERNEIISNLNEMINKNTGDLNSRNFDYKALNNTIEDEESGLNMKVAFESNLSLRLLNDFREQEVEILKGRRAEDVDFMKYLTDSNKEINDVISETDEKMILMVNIEKKIDELLAEKKRLKDENELLSKTINSIEGQRVDLQKVTAKERIFRFKIVNSHRAFLSNKVDFCEVRELASNSEPHLFIREVEDKDNFEIFLNNLNSESNLQETFKNYIDSKILPNKKIHRQRISTNVERIKASCSKEFRIYIIYEITLSASREYNLMLKYFINLEKTSKNRIDEIDKNLNNFKSNYKEFKEEKSKFFNEIKINIENLNLKVSEVESKTSTAIERLTIEDQLSNQSLEYLNSFKLAKLYVLINKMSGLLENLSMKNDSKEIITIINQNHSQLNEFIKQIKLEVPRTLSVLQSNNLKIPNYKNKIREFKVFIDNNRIEKDLF